MQSCDLEQGSGRTLLTTTVWDSCSLAALAIHSHSQSWTLIQGEDQELLEIPTDVQIIGLSMTVEDGPALITIAPDHKTISILHRNGQIPLSSADSPIQQAATGHGYIAWLSQSGRLMVYALRAQAVVLDLLAGKVT